MKGDPIFAALSKSIQKCAIVPLQVLLPPSQHWDQAMKICETIRNDANIFDSSFCHSEWNCATLEKVVEIVSITAAKALPATSQPQIEVVKDGSGCCNFEVVKPRLLAPVVSQIVSVNAWTLDNLPFPSSWEGPYCTIAVPVLFKDEAESNELPREILKRIFEIFQSDPRRIFMYGITMTQTKLQLWYCSRSAVLKGQEIDLSKDHDELIRLIISLIYATPEELGKDPTITSVIYLPCGDDADEAPQLQHRIQVGPKPTKGRPPTFITQKLHYQSSHFLGRSMRLWEVYSEEEGESNTKKDRSPMTLMDLWLKPGDELMKTLDAYAERRVPIKVQARWKVDSKEEAKVMDALPSEDWQLENIDWKIEDEPSQEIDEQPQESSAQINANSANASHGDKTKASTVVGSASPAEHKSVENEHMAVNTDAGFNSRSKENPAIATGDPDAMDTHNEGGSVVTAELAINTLAQDSTNPQRHLDATGDNSLPPSGQCAADSNMMYVDVEGDTVLQDANPIPDGTHPQADAHDANADEMHVDGAEKAVQNDLEPAEKEPVISDAAGERDANAMHIVNEVQDDIEVSERNTGAGKAGNPAKEQNVNDTQGDKPELPATKDVDMQRMPEPSGPYAVLKKTDIPRVHYRIVYKDKSRKTIADFKKSHQMIEAMADVFEGISKMNLHGDLFGTMHPDYILLVKGQGMILDLDGNLKWEYSTPESLARSGVLPKK